MNEFIAEVLGTAVLIFLGNGVVANVLLKDTKGHDSGWLVITTAWGFAVFVAVFMVSPYSGAHINPAVTIGLAVAGKFAWSKVWYFILAQMIGAMIGASLVYLMYKDHYKLTEDGDAIRATFCTSPAIRNNSSNFLSELLGTFILVLAVLLIIGPSVTVENSQDIKVGLGSLEALPVALVVFVIGLSLGGTTGYAINPARDLGPRLVHSFIKLPTKSKSDWKYSWIPVLGPITGGVLAALFFYLLVEYFSF